MIELPDEQVAALRAKAEAQGLTLEAWLEKLSEVEPQTSELRRPLKSAYGLLAKFGPAPSAEEIDTNRADMFRSFGEDF